MSPMDFWLAADAKLGGRTVCSNLRRACHPTNDVGFRKASGGNLPRVESWPQPHVEFFVMQSQSSVKDSVVKSLCS